MSRYLGSGGPGPSMLSQQRDALACGRDRDLWLMAGYVSFGGLAAVTAQLRQALHSGNEVRLLLGVQPPASEHAWEVAAVERTPDAADVDRLVRAYHEDVDDLPVTGAAYRRMRDLLSLLQHDGFSARLNTRRFVHGKVWLQPGAQVTAGSHNLTFGGLRSNAEAAVSTGDPRAVADAEDHHARLWGEAEPFDLAALLRRKLLAWLPELVWLKMVQATTGTLADLTIPDGELYRYQADGIARLLRILYEQGRPGALLADVAGAGKTRQAAGVIAAAAARGERTLVVVPNRQVYASAWRPTLSRWALYTDVATIHELRAGHVQQMHDYGLVVLDEAHAFRNPDTDAVAALDQLLATYPNAKLLAVTATPVHNRAEDLATLISRILRQDIPAGLLCEELLDAVTVRRDIHFLREFHPGEIGSVPDVTHTWLPWTPAPEVARLVDEVVAQTPGLSMRLYAPDPATPPRTAALVRTSLRHSWLCQLESSPTAFAETVERFAQRCIRAAQVSASATGQWPHQRQGDDEAFDVTTLDPGQRRGLARQLRSDARTARRWARTARRSEDRKMQASVDRLVEELAAGRLRHAIVFNRFRATADALADALDAALADRGDVTVVRDAGADDPALYLERNDHVLLVATDRLAEGVNLQAADRILHHDKTWTGERLEQRQSRAARQGSEHEQVTVDMLRPAPAFHMVRYLELIEHKVAVAAGLTGHPNKVTPDDVETSRWFADTPTQGERLPATTALSEIASRVVDSPTVARWLDEMVDGAGAVLRGTVTAPRVTLALRDTHGVVQVAQVTATPAGPSVHFDEARALWASRPSGVADLLAAPPAAPVTGQQLPAELDGLLDEAASVVRRHLADDGSVLCWLAELPPAEG